MKRVRNANSQKPLHGPIGCRPKPGASAYMYNGRGSHLSARPPRSFFNCLIPRAVRPQQALEDQAFPSDGCSHCLSKTANEILHPVPKSAERAARGSVCVAPSSFIFFLSRDPDSLREAASALTTLQVELDALRRERDAYKEKLVNERGTTRSEKRSKTESVGAAETQSANRDGDQANPSDSRCCAVTYFQPSVLSVLSLNALEGQVLQQFRSMSYSFPQGKGTERKRHGCIAGSVNVANSMRHQPPSGSASIARTPL